MGECCNNNPHQLESRCSCGCGCNCGCGGDCKCGRGYSSCKCNCVENFLKLADDAWTEVLKEKIKNKIIAHKGEHIEKLAEIIAKANGEKWKNIISAKNKSHELKDKLKEFFSSHD